MLADCVLSHPSMLWSFPPSILLSNQSFHALVFPSFDAFVFHILPYRVPSHPSMLLFFTSFHTVVLSIYPCSDPTHHSMLWSSPCFQTVFLHALILSLLWSYQCLHAMILLIIPCFGPHHPFRLFPSHPSMLWSIFPSYYAVILPLIFFFFIWVSFIYIFFIRLHTPSATHRSIQLLKLCHYRKEKKNWDLPLTIFCFKFANSALLRICTLVVLEALL